MLSYSVKIICYHLINILYPFFSFTFEVWLSLDTGYTTGPYPIVCSDQGTVCFSVESGVVKGRYGDSTVTGSTTLTAGQWHSIVFRHSIEGRD